MHIDIFSDVICPWCFIGKLKLGRALDETGVKDARLNWRAFQLNPDMPREGVERRTYLIEKFGDERHASQIYGRIAEAGCEAGLHFAFDRIPRTPNTVNAHRLIRLAGQQGCQNELVEALFRAYFLEGVDIGDVDELLRLGNACGLAASHGDLAAWIKGDEEHAAVKAEQARARELGITAVPYFIFEGRLALSGAQPVNIFKRALQSASSALDAAK